MQELPHRYSVSARSAADGLIEISSEGLTSIQSAAPAEFGGPGNRWSPETLLVAAVADCFILTFKAIARASKFEWVSLSCSVEGVLDRVDGAMRFTEFTLHVILEPAAGTDDQMAMRLLEKSEHTCLITKSLTASTVLRAQLTKPKN